MIISKHKLNIEYAATQALYWMGFCCCISFATLFLQGRGYSNTQLGLILGLGNLLGFFLAQYLATLIDDVERLNSLHCLCILVLLELLLSIYFILNKGSGLLVALSYCIYVACGIAVCSLNNELCFELDGWTGQINFGATRSAGSVAYAALAVLLGQLVSRFGTELLPVVSMSILTVDLLFMLFLLWQMKKSGGVQRPISSGMTAHSHSTAEFIKANKKFSILLIGTVCMFFSHSLMNTFLINVVEALDGDAAVMGGLNGYSAVMEFPGMIGYVWLVSKIRCHKILKFSATGFLLRALVIALAPSIAWLYMGQTIQGVAYALLTPALVHYTSLNVSSSDSAKGQMLAASTSNLGAAFATLFGGAMIDALSLRTTMLTGAAVCAVGVLIAFIFAGSSKADSLSPPSILNSKMLLRSKSKLFDGGLSNSRRGLAPLKLPLLLTCQSLGGFFDRLYNIIQVSYRDR